MNRAIDATERSGRAVHQMRDGLRRTSDVKSEITTCSTCARPVLDLAHELKKAVSLVEFSRARSSKVERDGPIRSRRVLDLARPALDLRFEKRPNLAR